MVGLEIGEGGSRGRGLGDGGVLDVGEGCAAVDLRLAGSKEVEVGAVEEEDLFGPHFEGVELVSSC